jgi:transposase
MTELGEINLHAAGMDLGTEQIFVSADGETVKAFGTFTSDLQDLKLYLIAEGVTTVMMEATGVLWVSIFLNQLE